MLVIFSCTIGYSTPVHVLAKTPTENIKIINKITDLLAGFINSKTMIKRQRHRSIISGGNTNSISIASKTAKVDHPSRERISTTYNPTVFSVISNLILRPYPWEKMPPSDKWKPINIAFSILSIYWYLMLFLIVIGIRKAFKNRNLETISVLIWVMVIGIPMSLVLVNFGTLFRMRDAALMPFILLINVPPCFQAKSRTRTFKLGS